MADLPIQHQIQLEVPINFSLQTFIYINVTHSSTKSDYQSSNSAGTDATGRMSGKVPELLGIDMSSEHQQHFKARHGNL
ncbi:MAG: hypothetical protein U9N36_03720, partial [Euryarchaeota archaeon]|nr:hypothetical protein [Euryarchaeota archaeon]